MSYQTWVETLVTEQSAQAALTSTTGAFSIINPVSRYVFPANYFNIGRTLRLTMLGTLSNSSLTAATLTLNVTAGPASSVNCFTTGAMTLSTGSSGSSLPFMWQAWMTVRGFSTGATFMGQSRFTAANIVTAIGATPSQTQATILGPITSPSAGTAFDATQASMLDVQAACSVSTTGITYGSQLYILEALN